MNTYIVISAGAIVQVILADDADDAYRQKAAEGDLFLRVGGGRMSEQAMPRLGVPDFPPEAKP